MQIVGFDRTPEAALLIAEDETVERVPLKPGTALAYGLGEQHCAGSIQADRHMPCDRTETPRCPAHTESWVCARCRGTCLKDEMDCFQAHVVYLAIVAPDRLKVGVTKSDRVETRMHEQGADRGAIIHRVANGRIAREIEADIATELPERIPTTAKIEGLTRSVDEDLWESTLTDFTPKRRLHPEYGLDLDTQPIHETIANGEIVGTKGRLLVLAVGGTPYVTDLRDLVGYHVSPETANPDVQSGLGAFS